MYSKIAPRRIHNHALRTMLVRTAFLLLVPPDPGLSRRGGLFLIRLFENQLSMLKAKGPWRHARHLVEAPREVTLVGESSREGDVNEREICAREQLLRTQ